MTTTPTKTLEELAEEASKAAAGWYLPESETSETLSQDDIKGGASKIKPFILLATTQARAEERERWEKYGTHFECNSRYYLDSDSTVKQKCSCGLDALRKETNE